MITNLEIKRREVGLNQGALAKKSKVHRTMICRYEKGNYQILNDNSRRRIAGVLEVSVEDLFSNDQTIMPKTKDSKHEQSKHEQSKHKKSIKA